MYSGAPLQDNEIRLIELLPGEWSDDTHCKLFSVRLKESTDYFTLSYVWGSPRVTRPILLDDRPFAATVNLESALRHVRHQYEEGIVLWVDALYID